MNKEISIQKITTQPDAWSALKAYTPARIALGRTGCALPLKEQLAFKLAHAHARDAVFSQLDVIQLQQGLNRFNFPSYILQSQATDRHIYLQRPDLGRTLQNASSQLLEKLQQPPADISVVIADGLSATAINENALPLLDVLMPALQLYALAPFTIVQQARVAVGDAIGALLHAKLVIMLIGERPGLSAADSLGVYITYNPQPGLTDEARNCISNIRSLGLGVADAAHKIIYLVNEAFRLQLSGVHLKDHAGSLR